VKPVDKELNEIEIKKYFGLVKSIARKYMFIPGIEFKDLIAEGEIALILARGEYDPHKKAQFPTYATFWIDKKMKEYINNKFRQIKIPSYELLLLRKYEIVKEKLRKINAREVTQEEVLNKLCLSQKQTSRLKKIIGFSVIEIDKPINKENKISMKDVIGDDLPDVVEKLIELNEKRQLEKAFGILDKREKRIIKMRWDLIKKNKLKSLKEISVILKISKERVRQLEIRAMIKLKGYLS
jgi:RNA polymerase sigma factor (sigma-70 family)